MHIAQGLFKAVNVWHSGHLILEVGVVGPKSSKVNKCTEAGGIFKFYVADWFALMNDKMGGDMKKIKAREQEGEQEGTRKNMERSESSRRVRTLRVFVPEDTGMYFVHVWKSCGMKMENVRFIWASDFIEENATEPLSCHVLLCPICPRQGEPGAYDESLEKPAVSRSVTRICQNFLPQKLSQKIPRMSIQTGVGWVFARTRSFP